MATLVYSPTLGMERIQREGLIVLMETLNEELANQEAVWATYDQELADLRGVPYVPITLETVATENFYPGHRPSLIEAPVEGYPNVSVMADRAGPGPFDDIDQMTNYSLRLWIEIMVKSLDGEEVVNARVQRMADAVNICMMSNPTLRGVINGIEGPPTINLSEVFPRKEKKGGYGREFLWQGGRLEYTITREASQPSGSFSRPAGTSAPTNLAGLDIDQSE